MTNYLIQKEKLKLVTPLQQNRVIPLVIQNLKYRGILNLQKTRVEFCSTIQWQDARETPVRFLRERRLPFYIIWLSILCKNQFNVLGVYRRPFSLWGTLAVIFLFCFVFAFYCTFVSSTLFIFCLVLLLFQLIVFALKFYSAFRELYRNFDLFPSQVFVFFFNERDIEDAARGLLRQAIYNTELNKSWSSWIAM